jgi:hypothetical protein
MSSPHLVHRGPAGNWRQVGDAAPTVAVPIRVSEWWKNRRGESIRLVLRQYQGRSIFDLRSWCPADGKLKPGEGFAAEIRHLPRLARENWPWLKSKHANWDSSATWRRAR